MVVKKLEAIGKNDPRIQRIMTIPGVGPRTAEILVACIDDPQCFASGREVSAYWSVPRQYQSGETDRNGRITKRGNPLARTILKRSVLGLRCDTTCGPSRSMNESAASSEVQEEGGCCPARKIAVIAWALMRDDKDWDPKRMIEVTRVLRTHVAGSRATLGDEAQGE
ncbi:MAG: transposase [Pirellulaceae bacterium]